MNILTLVEYLFLMKIRMVNYILNVDCIPEYGTKFMITYDFVDFDTISMISFLDGEPVVKPINYKIKFSGSNEFVLSEIRFHL